MTWIGRLRLGVRGAIDGVTACTLGGAAWIIVGCTLGGAICPRRIILCALGRGGTRFGTCTLGSGAGMTGFSIGAGRSAGITRTLGGRSVAAGAGGIRFFGGRVARFNKCAILSSAFFVSSPACNAGRFFGGLWSMATISCAA